MDEEYWPVNSNRLKVKKSTKTSKIKINSSNKFLSILINESISDSLCGTKVFSRKLFNLMKENGSWKIKSGHFTQLHGGSGVPN